MRRLLKVFCICIILNIPPGGRGGGERKANMLILKQHIHHFVKDAVKKVNGDEKINEIIEILHKIMNK